MTEWITVIAVVAGCALAVWFAPKLVLLFLAVVVVLAVWIGLDLVRHS